MGARATGAIIPQPDVGDALTRGMYSVTLGDLHLAVDACCVNLFCANVERPFERVLEPALTFAKLVQMR